MLVKLRIYKYFSVLTFLLFAISTGFAQEISLIASVNQNTVGLSDAFQFKLEVSGANRSLPEVELPPLNDFRVLSGPNQSSQFNMINGRVNVSKTYSVTLLAKKTGKFTIPSVSVKHKGNTYRSEPIVITVVQETTPAQSQNQNESGESQDLFIRAIPSKTKVYVNDQINVSYKVYFRVPIRNPDFIKLPETVGFWVEEYEIAQNIPVTQEVINGQQYSVAEVKKLALFPTKSGDLNITPLQLSVDVVERRRRRDPFSVFDDFFDDPLGRTTRKILSSREIKLDVQQLPANGKPENFSGLVGNFNMTVDIDKTTVKANEAITYKIKLSGSGNLKTLQDLQINFPESFEVFNPKISDNVNRRGDRLFFSRDMEYVIIPRSPGEYTLDPLEISFFDPTTKQYRTLRSREYLIDVQEGDLAAGMNSGNFTKSEVRLLGRDIHFIKEKMSDLVSVDAAPYTSGWFLSALFLPLLALGMAFGYRQHQEKMSTNVEYARKRQASKQAEKRLKTAKTLMNQQKFEAFYGEVSRALLGFVADKTNHSAAGLMRDNVASLLHESKVDESLIDEYLKCLDEADFRRFAPGQATPDAAQEFYDSAADLLSNLLKYFRK